MPFAPYSTAAALVNAITPAFAAEYTLVGMSDAFMPPIDDQLRITPPPVGSIVADAVLRAEQHALRSTAMIRSYSSSVMSASGCALADAGDVQHRVDAAERIERGREHRLDLASSVTSHVERHDRVAELGRGLLSPSR